MNKYTYLLSMGWCLYFVRLYQVKKPLIVMKEFQRYILNVDSFKY